MWIPLFSQSGPAPGCPRVLRAHVGLSRGEERRDCDIMSCACMHRLQPRTVAKLRIISIEVVSEGFSHGHSGTSGSGLTSVGAEPIRNEHVLCGAGGGYSTGDVSTAVSRLGSRAILPRRLVLPRRFLLLARWVGLQIPSIACCLTMSSGAW